MQRPMPRAWQARTNPAAATRVRCDSGTCLGKPASSRCPMGRSRSRCSTTPPAFGPLLAATLAILLTAPLTWFGGWLIRRHYGRCLELTRTQRIARRLSRLGVLACIATVFGWFLFIAAISANELLLVRGGLTPWMYLQYAMGVLALFGVIAVIANAVIAWFVLAFGLVSFNVRF